MGTVGILLSLRRRRIIPILTLALIIQTLVTGGDGAGRESRKVRRESKSHALFISLDMTDLAAVCTFPLCASGFRGRGRTSSLWDWGLGGSSGWAALLFLTGVAAFFVAVETTQFSHDAVGRRKEKKEYALAQLVNKRYLMT